MKVAFEKFKTSLPYASEIYGVYQPLLGWKSRLQDRRIQAGLETYRRRFVIDLFPRFQSRAEIARGTLSPRDVRFRIDRAEEGAPTSPLFDASQSIVARRAFEEIRRSGIENPDVWRGVTRPDSISELLNTVHDDLRTEYEDRVTQAQRLFRGEIPESNQRQILNDLLARESVAAGVLAYLHQHEDGRQLMALLTPVSAVRGIRDRLVAFEGLQQLVDPRKSKLASGVISPIGVVHLFRQYFFEFDTFLGPPVEHLWLSPGGQVELIEVSTRRTIIERTAEEAFDFIERSEKFLFLGDELSDAVRKLNSSSTKLGVSLNSQNSFSAGSIFTSQINTGTSFDLATIEEEAREQVHKGTRQQTERVATELKRSVKTTFKVVTETTDTNSRKYTILNNTPNLMNYELRRKMRQVGIQIQDFGTHLCWQTYVDKPGDELGLANLVHIAVPGDMPPRQDPQLAPEPNLYKGQTIKHHFRWPLETPSSPIGIGSVGLGLEFFSDVIAGRLSITPNPGFKLDHVEVKVIEGEPWDFRGRGVNSVPVAPGQVETTATEIEIFHPPHEQEDGTTRQPRTDEHPEFTFEITPVFFPSEYLLNQYRTANEAKIKEADQKQQREFKEKLFTAAKERVKLASKVQPRKFEDLREEERIIVYRNLIRQLLSDTGVQTAEPRVQHLFAELVQSMFDVDKMLYFVAPEWWIPRHLPNQQALFRPELNEAEFRKFSTVSWGGARAERDDNYYITEDSAPAKLGSSLGWVIQLDGDNLRNAFLNAPWVKAVIPIRERREKEAMDWLSASSVEGSDSLNSEHQPGNPDELARIREKLGLSTAHTVTIRDAIRYLIARIQEKADVSQTKPRDEDGLELDYLPPDRVYEKGFDPLLGGFRAVGKEPFEIFDQWVEVVPTGQIVPVEVEYDPKTGFQT